MTNPRDMTMWELMMLTAVNSARGSPTVLTFYDEAGALWEVTRALAGGWSRVYAGYDLDKRTLPYVVGPGFRGKRHGLNRP